MEVKFYFRLMVAKKEQFSIQRIIGKIMLKIPGWKINATLPDLDKYIIIVAPHTSNWDFYFGIAAKFYLNLDARWLGKHTIFRWPVRKLLMKIGGIPVDRSKRSGVVDQIAHYFKTERRMILGLAPEGTRKLVTRWRTGFYYLALKAQVPILMAYIDYGKKEIGAGPLYYPTGNLERDFNVIREFYRHITPLKPHLFALPEIDQNTKG